MLYDPKWQAPAFTLPHFIAWLERHPPETEYDYLNCSGGCLVGQYMADNGVGWNQMAYIDACSKIDGKRRDVSIRTFDIGAQFPRTFGAALERAKCLQESNGQ